MQNFSIDPNFSVYKLIERRQNVDAIINHRPTMTRISYTIEDATRVDGIQNHIFSSFQRLSRFLPQAERYREIAKNAAHVWIFGVPDIELEPIPNLTVVPIKPNHQLAKEWFVISYGPNFACALATEELTHIDDPDDERQFKGIWLFDETMVTIVHDWLLREVNAHMSEVSADSPHPQRQREIIENSIERMNDAIAAGGKVSEELQRQVEHTLRPSLANA